MKKLLITLLFSVGLTAQSFDFSCETFSDTNQGYYTTTLPAYAVYHFEKDFFGIYQNEYQISFPCFYEEENMLLDENYVLLEETETSVTFQQTNSQGSYSINKYYTAQEKFYVDNTFYLFNGVSHDKGDTSTAELHKTTAPINFCEFETYETIQNGWYSFDQGGGSVYMKIANEVITEIYQHYAYTFSWNDQKVDYWQKEGRPTADGSCWDEWQNLYLTPNNGVLVRNFSNGYHGQTTNQYYRDCQITSSDIILPLYETSQPEFLTGVNSVLWNPHQGRIVEKTTTGAPFAEGSPAFVLDIVGQEEDLIYAVGSHYNGYLVGDYYDAHSSPSVALHACSFLDLSHSEFISEYAVGDEFWFDRQKLHLEYTSGNNLVGGGKTINLVNYGNTLNNWQNQYGAHDSDDTQSNGFIKYVKGAQITYDNTGVVERVQLYFRIIIDQDTNTYYYPANKDFLVSDYSSVDHFKTAVHQYIEDNLNPSP